MDELNSEQAKTVGLIALLLFGLIGAPLIVQKFYNISAVEVSFVVIVIYFLINWRMNRN